MQFKEITNEDLSVYNNWHSSVETCHILQSTQWAEFKKGEWKPHFFIIENSGQVVAIASALVRNIPILNRPMIYLPRGPIFTDYTNKEMWTCFFDGITQFAKEIKAFLVRIDPAITVDNPCTEYFKDYGLISLKTDEGFGGLQPAATIRVNIKDSLEDIHKNFPKKTRYGIRYAEKNGVVYKTSGAEGLEDFYKVMSHTSKRAQFNLRPKSYYQKLLELYGDDVAFVSSYYEEDLISSGMYFKFGNKVWALYGGATDKHTNLQAGHGLEWTAMQWAKGKGAEYFDLFGIPVYRESENEKNKGVYGIYKFKKSFGGDEYDFIGEFDLPINKGFYKAFNGLDFAREVYINIRKRF